MKFKNLCILITSLLLTDAALAIDPVYEGDNGIRAKVFDGNCLRCHSSTLTGSRRNGAPSDVNWDTYEAAKSKAARAIERAVYRRDMPPGFSQLPVLNEDQRAALLAWQSGGFPRTSTSTGSYSINNQILTLPIVNVGIFQYRVTMRLTPLSSSPTGYGFTLLSADNVDDTSDNAAFYSNEIGQLHLQKIDVVNNGANTGQSVAADLLLVKGSSPLLFTLAYLK